MFITPPAYEAAAVNYGFSPAGARLYMFNGRNPPSY